MALLGVKMTLIPSIPEIGDTRHKPTEFRLAKEFRAFLAENDP